MNDPLIDGIAAALLINVINSAAAVLLIEYAKNKQWRVFTKIIFGGMLIRMAVVLTYVWFCVEFLKLQPEYFGVSLAIIYFLMLLGEIIYLNFRTNFVNLQDKKIQKGKIHG